MRLVIPSSTAGAVVTGPALESLPAYSAGATYALGTRVLFHDLTADNWKIYESAQAANTGHSLADQAWWIFVSVGNPYRMFDDVANTQTTALNSIVATFAPTPLANTVALLNVNAATANVTVKVGGVTVYDQTRALAVAGDGVTDWYEYFFGDYKRRTDVLFTDLPSFSGQVVTVTLTDIGSTVAIGTLAVGYGYYLGETGMGLSLGITDYSRKAADDFGQITLVPRGYSRRGSFNCRVENDRFDDIANLLPQFRARAAVWIGDDDLGATFIYGYYKDYTLVAQYEAYALLNIEIEGLV